MAITNAGSLLFALVAGLVSDRFGRKPTILISSILFIVGTVMLVFTIDLDDPANKWLFLAGR